MKGALIIGGIIGVAVAGLIVAVFLRAAAHWVAKLEIPFGKAFGLALAFSLTLAWHCSGDSFAAFENQTDSKATVKVLGAETNQVAVKGKALERLRLKGGEYYFKARLDLPGGPRYAIGPYFNLVDEMMMKHEVTIALKAPVLANLYEISKEQFETESGDSVLLRQANSASKAWLRWASIVLSVVSERQEEMSKMMFETLTRLQKEPITSRNYQGLNVGALAGGTKASIRDIIRKHGEPTARGTATRSVNRVTKEVAEFDVYSFDGIILLECRKGLDNVEWLDAPTMWFIEGIRKKAQRTLDRAK